MPMLKETYPHLEQGYARLYRKTYAPEEYTKSVLSIVDASAAAGACTAANATRPQAGARPARAQLTQGPPPRRRKPAPVEEPRAGQLALALTA